LQRISLTFENLIIYNKNKLLAGEGSSLAPLPFPFSNLGASPASASSRGAALFGRHSPGLSFSGAKKDQKITGEKREEARSL
jgi:hypothetical protein